MTLGVILVAIVILLCILADKFSGKFGMPALLLFMFIGMLFGSDGIVKIPFDNFETAEHICMLALLFIMFYGGFNTKWKLAKPVAVKAVLLSTAGVAITAGITAALCYLCLHFSVEESFLIGAVLSSTDAASVFSILRKKKLNLKDGTASLLELESGSNDPISYMLTVIGIGLVSQNGSTGAGSIALSIFTELFFGLVVGVGLAFLAIWLLKKTSFVTGGLDTIFMIAIVLLSYGLCEVLHGNPYLSIYLLGIIIGNSRIKNKDILIPFFDGITVLAQILLFFLLGLLAFPHKIPAVLLPAAAIVVFLTLIARPIAVFALLKPFGCSVRQCILVSWAGLRGAASIVFAIMVVAREAAISYDLYHIVFLVALFSVAIQGTLLPLVAKKTDMVDESEDVRKTFNDYQEESAITMMRMYIPQGHAWVDKCIREVHMPTGSLALMIKRGGETMVPKGDTQIHAGDDVILSVPAYEPADSEDLEEITIEKGHEWCNHSIAELNLSDDELIAMIIRGEENLIPDGKTVICEGDIVVAYR